MNIELTSRYGDESIIVNWDNVSYMKPMKCDHSKGEGVRDDVYTEVNFINDKTIYIKETLKEVGFSLSLHPWEKNL